MRNGEHVVHTEVTPCAWCGSVQKYTCYKVENGCVLWFCGDSCKAAHETNLLHGVSTCLECQLLTDTQGAHLCRMRELRCT